MGIGNVGSKLLKCLRDCSPLMQPYEGEAVFHAVFTWGLAGRSQRDGWRKHDSARAHGVSD